MTSQRFLVAGTALLTMGFTALVLWYYRLQPSPAAAFLVLGWACILVCGFLLWRAAQVLVSSGQESTLPQSREAIDDRRREELEREKKLLLKAIKEIEFDHDMGKVSDEDAHASTARYRARAVQILKMLEEEPNDYQAVVEKELAKRMAKSRAGSPKEAAE
ncbi:MAG: hypothetical protein HY698_17295 [Deltaproteobacteria bacterium]|nr:hypothetical protein [Deltaproteobacteria bacterium]